MPSWTTPVYFAFLAVLLVLFRQPPPFLMASTPASDSQPWADQPIQLVGTPQYLAKKTDLFAVGASHMALLHNSIFRGYNSIFLQAPHVRDADKPDFVGYCLTWYKFVKSHHDDEEETLFTKVEELLDDKDVFADTHKEHGTAPPIGPG